jgi:hypothetical protein
MKTGSKVKCYRNLNKPSYFSVKGKDEAGKERVLGYSQTITLVDCKLTGAHSKAQTQIEAGAQRSVHAYAQGTIADAMPSGELIEVTYRPKERAGFFIIATGATITEADAVLLTNSKMFCINPR